MLRMTINLPFIFAKVAKSRCTHNEAFAGLFIFNTHRYTYRHGAYIYYKPALGANLKRAFFMKIIIYFSAAKFSRESASCPRDTKPDNSG